MAESISSRVAWKLRKVISGGSRDAPSRTGTATVQRRDADGTVWVRFPGSSIDTPVTGAVVANVAAGDTISYDLSGGRMSVTGNASDPAAGVKSVGVVRKAAESAAKVASGAQDIANAIGQHFWADDNGAHVSTEKGDPTGERNILMNSLGILLRQGSAWLASFSDSAVAFYDGLGNAAANVVAQFGADGAVIGRSGESHMELDYHSLRLVDKEGGYYFYVSDMRNEDGSITEAFEGDGTTTEFNVMAAVSSVIWVKVNSASVSYTLRGTTFVLSSAPASGATVEICYVPTNTWKSLVKAYTFGIRKAGRVGLMSVAEGYNNTASGEYSHVEGMYTTTSGFRAHAEGRATTASGNDSHAEGDGTQASGSYSHAEGLNSKATDSCSHAEGYNSTASGDFSHAQNEGTVAAYDSQTAIGKYNANDPNNAFEIGNGTADDARSNAFAVTWDGTVTAAGEVKGASVSATVTLASGVSATTHTVKRSGNVVTLYIDGLNLAAELANHGSATVATVPSGYRPAYAAYAQLSGWNNGGSYATVGTNGSVTVSNQSGAAIPTARSLGLTLTYVM